MITISWSFFHLKYKILTISWDYAGRLVPVLFLKKKALYEVKASGLQLSFNMFREPLTWHAIKTNCVKLWTIDPEIYSFFIF